MATVTRVIAADPTSTALLVAAWEGVTPRRGTARFAVRLDVAGRPARLTLATVAYSGAHDTGAAATLAILTVAGPARSAAAFLATLADAAEERADAA